MKRLLMFAAAAMFVMLFGTTTAKADCSDCCPDGYGGTYCYFGSGPWGACVTDYTPDATGYNVPSCRPLSNCDGTAIGGGGGGGFGGDDGWGPENRDPACSGWGGCSAECSSCW